MTKPAEGPRCLNCNKPLRKATDVARAPRLPMTYVPAPDWQYSGNKHVVARRYELVDPVEGKLVTEHTREDHPARWARRERRLSEVHVWDGESYQATAGFFCSGPCAHGFAQAAVRAGYRRRPKAQELQPA